MSPLDKAEIPVGSRQEPEPENPAIIVHVSASMDVEIDPSLPRNARVDVAVSQVIEELSNIQGVITSIEASMAWEAPGRLPSTLKV